MFCIYCGTKLPEEANFCYRCGKKVISIYSNEGAVQQPQPVTASAPVVEPVREAAAVVVPPAVVEPVSVVTQVSAYVLPSRYVLETYRLTLSEKWRRALQRFGGQLLNAYRNKETKFTMWEYIGEHYMDELPREQTEHFMETLICTFFGDHDIYANIPYAVLFPELSRRHRKDGMNVSYLLCKNGRPAVAIQLLDPDIYNRAVERYTWKALAETGIPALRFFYGWENELHYCVDRIKNCLNSRT